MTNIRFHYIISYALVNPQRSVAHTATIICLEALKVQMQPNLCLPDGVVAVVCSLLKDGQEVDKMRL